MMRSPAIIVILMLTASVAAFQHEATGMEQASDKSRHAVGESPLLLQAVREPALTLSDVHQIIDHFECFEQMPDRAGVNPFTNEALVFPGEGAALYLENGDAKGNFSLQEGRILFTGVPEDIAREAAALVSARLESRDSS